MAFNPAPTSFFGPTYEFDSGLKSVSWRTTAGVGTNLDYDSEDLGTSIITLTADHSLKVGDAVTAISGGGTLPVPLSDSWTYYVESVPTPDSFTLSETPGGAMIGLLVAGSAGAQFYAQGNLPLDAADADATTGDSRAVIHALMEMLLDRWDKTEAADRPSKVSISRSFQGGPSDIAAVYIVTVRGSASSLEVAPE